MKIFNHENKKEKVYVQMNDIMMLNQSDESIPTSIFEKVFTGIVIVDDRNRMDFVKFNKPYEIEFFKKIDWIVDYKETISLSIEEIAKLAQETINQRNDIAENYNKLPENKKEEKYHSTITKIDLLDYKTNYYSEIIKLKLGKLNMPFPLVKDSNSKLHLDNGTYEAEEALAPRQILIHRIDNKPITKTEIIPEEFLNAVVEKTMSEKPDNYSFSEEFETTKCISQDSKYLIATIVKKSPLENKDNFETAVETEKKENKKGIKQMIKSIFKK